MDLIPVILCGGSGTRLWPLSRHDFPKQFHVISGEHTLFQQSLLRAQALSDHPPMVVTAENYRFLVKAQAEQVGVSLHAILLEPVAKNTAPAVALAALAAQAKSQQARLFVMSADHYFSSLQPFEQLRSLLSTNPLSDCLLTFGIKPSHPNTGYGYIELGDSMGHGMHHVARFIEKPPLDQAETFVASDRYLWNSGMFAFSAAFYLSELARYQPAMHRHCTEAWQQHSVAFGCTLFPADVLNACPSDSIDYAVLEHSEHIAVMPLSVEWSDVGSWLGLQQVLPADADGNTAVGAVRLHGSQNNVVFAKHRSVTTVGLKEHVVVETADSVLVMHKDHAPALKAVVQGLLEQGDDQALRHDVVHRPWGSYEVLTEFPGYKVKRIIVKSGESLSLQRHQKRSEHWVVVKGEANVVVADKKCVLTAGESIDIPVTCVHQLSNQGDEDIELIEVQLGDYLGEDDIERLHDVYGRVAPEQVNTEEMA